MNTNLPALVERYGELRQKYDSLVLATIIETMGSTYRKAGARMLITPEAKFFGLLGGGCFEADLLAHAAEVFETRENKIVFYDMRAPEDEIWGLGLGCNGAVRILLQYISSGSDSHILSLVSNALELNRRQVLLSICESEHTDPGESDNLLLQFDDSGITNFPQTWPEEIQQQSLQTARSGTAQYAEYVIENRRISVFSSEIKPVFQLMIVGAGPDAEPIIRLARELGWKINLVDYRETFLEQECFEGVDNKILAGPEELESKSIIREIDALVLMTHKIEYDERYLKHLTQTTAGYIGLLGPAARRDRLLDALGEDVTLIQDRVFGPVGLDIGGESPEEIALSLVAEIQATHYGRNAQSLHIKNEPLHDQLSANNSDLYAIILAAGGAKRFGGLKQMLEYKGMSLLRRSVIAANALVDGRVKVVLGARARKIQREIDKHDVAVLHNNDWESGMASSIQLGIESLPDNCSGILLMLCDQALVDIDQLQQINDRWLNDKSRIVASAFAGTIGSPVIIPRQYFPEIMKLKGDRGAKSIIERYPDEVDALDIPEAEFDIDTEEDYTKLISSQSSSA